jgi:heptosyltransferase-2
MKSASKKILIVGPSWVGDMVMAQSLFITLQNVYRALNSNEEGGNECVIDVLAPSWSLPILERMPEVRRGITMPVGHGKLNLGARFNLARSLATEKYDQAIVLPNSLKSALIPLIAGIPRRTGWRGEMRFGLLNDIRLLNKKLYPLMVQRFVALAFSSDAPPPENCPPPALITDSTSVDGLFEKYQIDKTLPLLALCAGAEFGPSKRWPEKHFAAVAKEYITRGWQVGLFGSANDKLLSDDIRSLLSDAEQKKCINLAGETALSEAVDILSKAAAVVSNDSGLMHICAALNRPMAVVYGSTSPEFTPPLSEKFVIKKLDVECAPCFQRECPLSEKDGRMKCLQELKPDEVIAGLDTLL